MILILKNCATNGKFCYLNASALDMRGSRKIMFVVASVFRSYEVLVEASTDKQISDFLEIVRLGIYDDG